MPEPQYAFPGIEPDATTGQCAALSFAISEPSFEMTPLEIAQNDKLSEIQQGFEEFRAAMIRRLNAAHEESRGLRDLLATERVMFDERTRIIEGTYEKAIAMVKDRMQGDLDALLRLCKIWGSQPARHEGPHPWEEDVVVFHRLLSERDFPKGGQPDAAEEIDREASQDETLRFTESDTVVPTKAGADTLKGDKG